MDEKLEIKISDIPIFVVTIKSSNNHRVQRLQNRLKYFNLDSNSTFVYGYLKDSELVKYYSYKNLNESSVISCTMNHFLCIKKFLETKKEYGMILEDDAVLHIDFVNKINELLKILINNILLLSFTHGTEYHKQINPAIGLNDITHWTCGAMGYIITRDYAIKVLHMFDKPGINDLQPDKNTSEVITTYSNGKYVNPPLIIEEGLSSLLNHDVNTHLNWMKEYANYNDFMIPTEDIDIINNFKKYIKN